MRLNPKDTMTEEQTAAVVAAMNATQSLLDMMLESIKELDGRMKANEAKNDLETASDRRLNIRTEALRLAISIGHGGCPESIVETAVVFGDFLWGQTPELKPVPEVLS